MARALRIDSLTATGWLILPLLVAVGAIPLLSSTGSVTPGSGRPAAWTDPRVAVLDQVAGLALLVVGLTAWAVGPSRRVGAITVVAGFVWVLPYVLAEPVEAALGRLTVASAALLIPILTGLVVVASTRVGIRRLDRSVILGLIVIGAVIAVVRAMTFDPLLEPGCAVGCNHVSPILELGSGTRMVARRSVFLLMLVAGVWLSVCAIREIAASREGRGRTVTLMAGSIIGLAAIGLAAIRLTTTEAVGAASIASPFSAQRIWSVLAAGVVVLAGGIAWSSMASVRARMRIQSLADEIESAPTPGTVALTLAAALGDDTVSVGYRIPGQGRFVDADGALFDPDVATGSTRVTIVEYKGEPVAAVRHAASVNASALTRGLGPSFLIALDNERLRAANLSHLRELRASRTRIVEVGEAERRRVERDIHDGTQQRLLAVAFDLKLAHAEAERLGDTARAEQLADLEIRSFAAVEELRRIASGIHPAVLTQAGLAPALDTLAEDSPIAVEIEDRLGSRLPADIEAPIYRLVEAILADAVRREATVLTVRLDRQPTTVTVEAEDDAPTLLDDAVGLEDRVGAAGGTLSVGRRPGSGTILIAELPCG